MSKISFPCNPPFVVSQRFGENHDYYFNNFKEKGHNGWDFALPVGTPLFATHDGTITYCATTNFGDLAVSIMDASGKFRTIYGHLSEFKVKLGDVVKKGQLVALSGNTGRYTTGAHLHFGIHEVVNGSDINLDNGFNGGIDPALSWDGTYPYNYVENKYFNEFQKALLAFQLSEGINDFANEKELARIKIGNKTLTALKKYQK